MEGEINMQKKENNKSKVVDNIVLWIVTIVILGAFYAGYIDGRADKHSKQNSVIESTK